MKCDECLVAHQSRSVTLRRAARRHAAACPNCAHAIAALEAMKRELAEARPLTSTERQLWMRAVVVEGASGVPARRPIRRRVLGGAIATAAVLLAAGIWYGSAGSDTGRPPADNPPQMIATSRPATLVIAPHPALREQLQQLADQLEQLSLQAALLNERQDLRLLSQKTHEPSTGRQP